MVSASDALIGEVSTFPDAGRVGSASTCAYRSTAKALFAATAAVRSSGDTADAGTRARFDCAMTGELEPGDSEPGDSEPEPELEQPVRAKSNAAVEQNEK